MLSTFERRRQALATGTSPDNAPGISCKRKDILRLSRDDYRTWADAATAGFQKAAKLLYSQKLFDARDLPYRTQLTPLAAILALLGDRADNDGVRHKLMRWYWCGVFGELYGGAIETRFARDVPEVLTWIGGGPEPDTVAAAHFTPMRLLTLQTRNSAAYKGLSALLLREGGQDFRTGDLIEAARYFDERVDIHHIFPKDWCAKQGIDRRRGNSIINKTPLDAKTNRIISNNPPSVYLARLERHAGISEMRMNEILASHVIPTAALRMDDFDRFFAERTQALLERIECAMGKPVVRDAGEREFMAGDADQAEESEDE